MIFYLGTHHTSQKWFDLGVPLFISRRVLTKRKGFPQPQTQWALDSGGFTELTLHDEWRTSLKDYTADVLRFQREMGHLAWVSPQDWMCEPHMIEKTGLSVSIHQRRTVYNFLSLRQHLGSLVIPVLQGWELEDYRRCWELYETEGIHLEDESIVGLGSVCRRQNTREAEEIVRSLKPLRLHYYGAKMTGLGMFADGLVSADSMAWSFRARYDDPLPGCTTHKNCANCEYYAMQWRDKLMRLITEPKEIAA